MGCEVWAEEAREQEAGSKGETTFKTALLKRAPLLPFPLHSTPHTLLTARNGGIFFAKFAKSVRASRVNKRAACLG